MLACGIQVHHFDAAEYSCEGLLDALVELRGECNPAQAITLLMFNSVTHTKPVPEHFPRYRARLPCT